MYLDHRIIAKIARVLGQINMQVMLLDSNGQVILPEDDRRELTLPEALIKNPTKPLVYGGFTLIGTEDAQPLFICLAGDSAEVQSCAVLSAELINMITRIDIGQVNLEQSMRLILRGEVEGPELEAVANEHSIPLDRERCVMYLHFYDIETDVVMNILTNALPEDSYDMVAEVGRHSIAVVKTIDDRFEFSEMEQLGLALENTFMSETNRNVFIGIGDPRATLAQLPESYEEAKNAINVGRVYHTDVHVFVYRKLLLERFLSEIPADMGNAYNQLMFNRKTARLFNEEMVRTIEKFFENNLNLSETARQLYIHRNTLVYRLDKVQRIIGLDLRSFDDAVTLKLMMLLGKGDTDRKSRI